MSLGPSAALHRMPSMQESEPWKSALRTINQVAASALGPHGRSQLVQAGKTGGGGAVTVTSTSHRIFDALRIDHPAARVLLQLLAARQARGADGGLLTVLLASSLVLGAGRRRLPTTARSLLPEVLTTAPRAPPS